MTSSSAVLRGLRSANLSLRPGEGQTVNVKLLGRIVEAVDYEPEVVGLCPPEWDKQREAVHLIVVFEDDPETFYTVMVYQVQHFANREDLKRGNYIREDLKRGNYIREDLKRGNYPRPRPRGLPTLLAAADLSPDRPLPRPLPPAGARRGNATVVAAAAAAGAAVGTAAAAAIAPPAAAIGAVAAARAAAGAVAGGVVTPAASRPAGPYAP